VSDWRKKYARFPAVIAALERTRARVKRDRRLAVTAVVIASTSTLDAVVQSRAAEARLEPPAGYVSADGGPSLRPSVILSPRFDLADRTTWPKEWQ
jgi:hypothetical protein